MNASARSSKTGLDHKPNPDDLLPESKNAISKTQSNKKLNLGVTPTPSSTQSLADVPSGSKVRGSMAKAKAKGTASGRPTKKKTKVTKKTSFKSLITTQSSSKSLVTKLSSSKNLVTKQPSSQILVTKQPSSQSLVIKESSSQNVVTELPSSGSLVPKQSSSKSLVTKQPSSKSLVSEAQSQASKEQKPNTKKRSQAVGKQVDSIDSLPYKNACEPLEVSHESIFSRHDRAVPPLTKYANTMDTSLYLARVQGYFDQLGYHRDGEPEIRIDTRLSIKHLLATARDLIKAGEPIKCLHALILSLHFTNVCTLIERFPLHFKSKLRGREFKHVVMGVYAQGYFGTLGISRDDGLQDKPPVYPRLSELIHEFFKCYTDSGHELIEVKIGSIITHDPHSLQTITWKLGLINFRMPPGQIELEIERCSKKLRSQMGLACLRCVRPSAGAFGILYPQNPNVRRSSYGPRGARSRVSTLGIRQTENFGRARSLSVMDKSKGNK